MTKENCRTDKKEAIAIIDNYDDFTRQPDSYKGKKMLFTVKIDHVSQKENVAELIAVQPGQEPIELIIG